MNKSSVISNFSAGIAIISILFLPVVGCENDTITGLEILNSSEVGSDMKFFTVLAIVFGVFIFFLKNHVARAICALAGGISLLIAYMIARGQNELIELKIGAFIAVFSYTVTALINFLKSNDEERIVSKSKPDS